MPGLVIFALTVGFVAGWAASWRIDQQRRLTLTSIRSYWQHYHAAQQRHEQRIVKDTQDLLGAHRRGELEDSGPVVPVRGDSLLERAMPEGDGP